MTSASLLVTRVLALPVACFALVACSGEGRDDGTPGGTLSLGGAPGAGGRGSLDVGGRAGAPGAGAGGTDVAGAGGGAIVETNDCDCVPVDPFAEEGPGYFVMGEPQDTCAQGERAFFREPNPAKCAPPTCYATHVSYYESSCVADTPVRGEYQSGVDDYATCRPLALPTRGSVLFESAKVYWSCSPGDPGPAFDQQRCARHFAPPATGACPAKTFCVPRSAGPVCVRGSGPPPAGWVKGDYANPSACIGTFDELTSPMQVTVFAGADCTGQSKDLVAETCATFADAEPRSYVIEEPLPEKTPTALELLEDIADLHCRP